MKRLMLFILVLFLSACSMMPPVNSINKKIAVMEVTYGELIDRAVQYRDEGRLSNRQIKKIKSTFEKIDLMRGVLYQALSAKDPTVNSKLQIITVAIAGLRSLLETIEKKEKNHVSNDRHNYTAGLTRIRYHDPVARNRYPTESTSGRPGRIGGRIIAAPG